VVVGWRGRESSLPKICLKNELLSGDIHIQPCSAGLKNPGHLKVELKGKACKLSLRDLELVCFLMLG